MYIKCLWILVLGCIGGIYYGKVCVCCVFLKGKINVNFVYVFICGYDCLDLDFFFFDL